jgi:hypothetical protein
LVHIPEKKNIQANSLSKQPNLCPQGIDNEDVIVLPEHLFVNLIDMELQKKIANAKNMDYDTAEAIKKLLEQGPKEAKKDLVDWEVEEFEGENVLFYKEKNYVPINAELQREIVQRYHDHPTAGHPGKPKHLTQSKNITGGQDFESLSKTMSRDVEHVNNSKLTEIQRNQCSCLWRGQGLLDHLLAVLWI